jgi:hypothetical protein
MFNIKKVTIEHTGKDKLYRVILIENKEGIPFRGPDCMDPHF